MEKDNGNMSDDISSPKRPLLVTIIGGLGGFLATIMFILGIITLVATMTNLISPADLQAWMEEIAKQFQISISDALNMTKAEGIIFTVFGLLGMIVNAGLMKGWRIMWYLGVIFNVIGLIGTAAMLVMAFTIADVIALIIFVVIVYYLFRPNVKAFFKI